MYFLRRLFRFVSLPPHRIARLLRRFLALARRHRRISAGVLLGALIAAVVADLTLAPRHLPWRPLGIDERGGFATDIKLRVYKLGPQTWCSSLVASSETLGLAAVDPLAAANGCGWTNGFGIVASGDIDITGSASTTMRCPLAAAAHIWLTSIDERARDMLGSPLASVHHFGTYSCRRMYNRQSGPMSQHAYANAWDVSGFELADGRVISVLADWNDGGPRGRFLKTARSEACRIFSVVLTPDYNEAHRDHFHLDMGNGLRCK